MYTRAVIVCTSAPLETNLWRQRSEALHVSPRKFVGVDGLAGNNVGKAIQKKATATLPAMVPEARVVLQYLCSPMWLLGIIADISGAALMVVALSMAPVSLVQPVTGLGLVLLAVFSHFFLQERLSIVEWLAAACAALGAVLLGLATADGPEPASPGLPGPPPPQLGLGNVLGFAAVLACLGAWCYWRHHSNSQAASRRTLSGPGVTGPGAGPASGTRPRRTSSGPGAAAGKLPAGRQALLCGLESGACFGLSGAATRTGFLLGQGGGASAVLGVVCSILLSSSGVLVQNRGLKEGSAVVVCTCSAVSAMASGVLVGLLVLGEAASSGGGQLRRQLLSSCLIVVGVGTLAAGSGGSKTLQRVLRRASAQCLSALASRRVLPQRLQVWARTSVWRLQNESSLPTSSPAALHEKY